jgi:Zn-dependent protease/predicted transcriptional regulator
MTRSDPREGGGAGRGAVSRGLSLFRIAGIQVRLDYSWFIIFAIVAMSLAAGYFPQIHPGQSTWSYWAAGILAAILFFLSILAHELSHAFMAKRSGIDVPAITLFLFGGVSEMQEEPRTPATELKVAIVGPLTSFGLAALFWGVRAVLPQGASFASAGFGYLAFINAALGVFNLLPGFPLDGGRVFRALVWWRSGSLEHGTRLAANVGKAFALGIMLLGGVQIFAGGLVGGIWLILIGLFLRGMAEAGYQSLVIRRALEDVSVERVAIREPVTVSPQLSIRELVEDYILGRGYRGFPVVEGDRVLGTISVAEVRGVEPEKRAETTVRDRMVPLSDAQCIAPDASLAEALKRLSSEGRGRLLVTSGDRLIGMLTKEGLARFVELRQSLEGGERG